jgi:uracil-DNA glycosylase
MTSGEQDPDRPHPLSEPDATVPEAAMTEERPASARSLPEEIVACRACARLVWWREECARRRPARFAGQEYWSRPVPGFGDPAARIYVAGLATSAHGGNRTGRALTGNPTASWVVAALHRAGLANQPTSEHRDDGLRLAGVWFGSVVRCPPPGDRPTAEERDACLPFLTAEVAALPQLRVVLCLGGFAWRAVAGWAGVRPLPTFGHGATHTTQNGLTLVASYHPSQQNTRTGVLTEKMLDAVIDHVRKLAR